MSLAAAERGRGESGGGGEAHRRGGEADRRGLTGRSRCSCWMRWYVVLNSVCTRETCLRSETCVCGESGGRAADGEVDGELSFERSCEGVANGDRAGDGERVEVRGDGDGDAAPHVDPLDGLMADGRMVLGVCHRRHAGRSADGGTRLAYKSRQVRAWYSERSRLLSFLAEDRLAMASTFAATMSLAGGRAVERPPSACTRMASRDDLLRPNRGNACCRPRAMIALPREGDAARCGMLSLPSGTRRGEPGGRVELCA